MSTLSQDNYVMEMEVQQEEWAKQKTTYRGDKSGLWGENNQNVHSFVVKVSVSACLTNVGQRGRAVKRNKDMSRQWSCSRSDRAEVEKVIQKRLTFQIILSEGVLIERNRKIIVLKMVDTRRSRNLQSFKV